MVLMTYQLPKNLTEIIKGGEFDEFDLNTFLLQKDWVKMLGLLTS